MRRIYFLLPDVEVARKVVDELLLARIADDNIHVIAKEGTAMKDLPVPLTHLLSTIAKLL